MTPKRLGKRWCPHVERSVRSPVLANCIGDDPCRPNCRRILRGFRSHKLPACGLRGAQPQAGSLWLRWRFSELFRVPRVPKERAPFRPPVQSGPLMSRSGNFLRLIAAAAPGLRGHRGARPAGHPPAAAGRVDQEAAGREPEQGQEQEGGRPAGGGDQGSTGRRDGPRVRGHRQGRPDDPLRRANRQQPGPARP